MHPLLRVFFLLVTISVSGAWAAAPTISNPTATPGTNGAVKLSASVTTGGIATTVIFSYGRTIAYGSTATVTLPKGDGAQVASANLTGLVGGATYNFQVNATNPDGLATPSGNQTFTVAAYKPALTLIPVAHATTGAVTLRATVTANGTPGTAFFQYGIDPTDPATATEIPLGGTLIVAGAVDFPVAGTVPAPFNADYRFRLVIKDAADVIIASTPVTKLNNSPKAVDDSYTLTGSEPLTLDVLDNDSDIENDEFEIVSTTTPRFGTVAINADGSAIIYTPKQTLFAVDTFRYTIRETVFGGTASATVTIRPLSATLGGTHGGIIFDLNGKAIGYFRITASTLGSFTGVVEIDGKNYMLSGAFAADGSFHGAASRDGKYMPVDFRTERGESGTTIRAEFGDGKYKAGVEFSDEEAEARGSLAGRYTVELPASATATPADSTGTDVTAITTTTTTSKLPEGTGWTALKVGEDGSVRVKGRLTDGRPFSARGALAVGSDGTQITFFDELKDTRIVGAFTVGDTVAGTLSVDRRRSNDKTFPDGYGVTLNANGARYVTPAGGGNITTSSGSGGTDQYTINFNGGGIGGTLTRNVQLTDGGQFKVLNGGREDLKIKVDPSSGRFTTKVTVNDDGRRVKGTGVFIQGGANSNGGNGAGVFNGVNQPGSIQIVPGASSSPTTPVIPSFPTPTRNVTPGAGSLNLQRR